MEGLKLERTRLLLGENVLNRLMNLSITVVGIGAVGSFAIEALARCGVGKFRLVDFDIISKTSFNRNLFALDETLGMKKVEAAAKRILSINPSARIETLPVFFDRETADSVLDPAPDFLIDAIDSVGPKTGLLYECYRRKINVISILGASSRMNPAKVTVGDISGTRECPLAKDIRKNLRRLGITRGITAVYSTEKPVRTFSPEELPEESVELYYERGRKRRILPSIVTLPGIFGLVAANHIILKVAGLENPFEKQPVHL